MPLRLPVDFPRKSIWVTSVQFVCGNDCPKTCASLWKYTRKPKHVIANLLTIWTYVSNSNGFITNTWLLSQVCKILYPTIHGKPIFNNDNSVICNLFISRLIVHNQYSTRRFALKVFCEFCRSPFKAAGTRDWRLWVAIQFNSKLISAKYSKRKKDWLDNKLSSYKKEISDARTLLTGTVGRCLRPSLMGSCGSR